MVKVSMGGFIANGIFANDHKFAGLINVLGGSLAKGNFDIYSDIDLHIIVTSEQKTDLIKERRKKSSIWGEV